MTRKANTPREKDVVKFTLRVPKELMELFEKAIELGYFEARSKNEALLKLMKRSLTEIFIAVAMFEETEERLKSTPDISPHALKFQIAAEIMQDPNAINAWIEYFASIVSATAALRDSNLRDEGEKFQEFVEKLKKIMEAEK